MKRLLFTLILLLLCCASRAHEFSFVNLSTQVTKEELIIDFDIKARALDLGCNGQVVLEFSVENPDRRLVLPVVVYSTPMRARFEARRRLLSDEYDTETFYVYDRVRKRDSYNLHYRFAVPYQNWMADAGLTFREYTHDCSGDRMTAGGRMMASTFGPAPSQVRTEVRVVPRVVYVAVPVAAPLPPPAATQIVERAKCDCIEGSVWEYRLRQRRNRTNR